MTDVAVDFAAAASALLAENAALAPRLDALEAYSERQQKYTLDADWYSDPQAALNDAALKGVPRVLFTPGVTYPLTTPLVVPKGVAIDDGGLGLTSFAPGIPQNLPHFKATAVMDYMVKVETYGSVRRIWIDGDNKAETGIYIDGGINNLLELNQITKCYTGIKLGGCLYLRMLYNACYAITGWGLDAKNAYSSTPEVSYFGVNVCESRGNSWGGAVGAFRVEGILTSTSEKFEKGASDSAEANITIGSPVIPPNIPQAHAGNVTMIDPYIELKRKGGSTHPLRAIKVNVSSRLRAFGAMGFGDLADPNAVLCEVAPGAELAIIGGGFARFATMFKGNTSGSTITVLGTTFGQFTTLYNFSYLELAKAVFLQQPGSHWGDGIVLP